MRTALAKRLFTATLIAFLIGVMATDAQALTRVRAVDFRFRPARVSIDRGTRVRWHNVTQGTTHTVTAYRGHWSKDTTIAAGDTTSFRFRRRGVYKYYCSIHAHITSGGRCVANSGVPTRMCGTVTVG
jgi:plastocyanin